MLAMRKDSGFTLSKYQIEDWFVTGQVNGLINDGSRISMMIYSVYILRVGVVQRKEAMEKLKESLLKVWQKGNCGQILLLGDFNMEPARLDRFLDSVHIGLRRIESSEATRVGSKGTESVLDYIAVRGLSNQHKSFKVLKETDLSDHLPIMAKWKLPSAPKVTKKLSIQTSKLLEKRGYFLSDERWNSLKNDSSGDELEPKPQWYGGSSCAVVKGRALVSRNLTVLDWIGSQLI